MQDPRPLTHGIAHEIQAPFLIRRREQRVDWSCALEPLALQSAHRRVLLPLQPIHALDVALAPTLDQHYL
jgi:hypothetical protein